MSGLVKAKKYDYKDSNLSLFGSDLERNIKKASAKTETAWANAGKKVGIQVWRIVKFKVAKWPGEDNGKFYSGDSYIILNTYKTPPSDELLYDVHFWIGKYSTQDEYGTAAYKTVELDTLLDDKPVQHREVQGYESDLFKTYFPTITLMKGGANSGFRHVDPKEYVARLLHVKGEKKKVTVKEVKMFRETLSSGDVFILDRGLEIFQWNGSSANKDEKFRALQYIQGLKSDRSGKPKVETLEERTMAQTHKFYTYLPEGGEPLKAPKDSEVKATEKVLLKVSDADGTLDCEEVARGSLAKSMLDSNDAFIVDSGIACYVWIGKGASPDERKKGMEFAHNYLMKTDHPFVPVTVIIEGQHEEEGFRACFS